MRKKEKLEKLLHIVELFDKRYRFNEFKLGRTSVFHEERPDRPADVASEEIFGKVREMILADRLSYGTVINILHDKLCMRKVSTRWMPRLLTDDNKRTRLSMSRHCLDLLKRNSKEFFRRVVTVDETWIQYYTPETKRQSKQ
ncbi:hypothetical protein RI129_005528 [Pyrocoelia pectoralis]|uniref:Transposase n=1 Tax=Pyrocoelia pectoralis TaxID=417401 RepID=A0AAN7VIB4_9COLE